ncbi:MAG TPA: phosphoribosylanthranilate isomerase, partial [Anaerolineae bacterium]
HARDIVAELRAGPRCPKMIGVFVNEASERVRAIMESAQLDLVQLHGSEPASALRELSPRAYKALRPRDEDEARTAVAEYREAANGSVPAFIVDAYDPKQFGGTGRHADWDIAAVIARQFPILLAGGLNSENVLDAIRIAQPWGVDVSSGVERTPGLKDHVKMRAFIRSAKSSQGREAEASYLHSREVQ